MQPRQIYASTVTRRDRRWTRRRGRGALGVAIIAAGTLVVAATVIATLAPGLG